MPNLNVERGALADGVLEKVVELVHLVASAWGRDHRVFAEEGRGEGCFRDGKLGGRHFRRNWWCTEADSWQIMPTQVMEVLEG